MGSSALKSLVTRAYQVFRVLNSNYTNQTTPGKHPPNNQHPQKQEVHVSPEIKSITDMMHSLNADVVNLHRIYSPKTVPRNMITFIEVANTPIMTVVIIVIPPGQRLPLHDHPSMTGIIKVLHGRVRVSTFTKVGDCEDGKQPAVKTQDDVLSRLSYPQVLTPCVNNVHAVEFESGEGGKDYAAFLDILSPPYDESVGCHYYICEEGRGNIEAGVPDPCTLVEVECPKDYHTFSLQYPFH